MAAPAYGFKRVLEALHRLDIPHMIGGSLASSIHGIPRSTRDVNIIADMRPEHIAPFAAALGGEFYADAEMMREALQRGRSFNLIHHDSSFKFDIFPLSPQPYSQLEFERKTTADYRFEDEVFTFYVSSPEDTILTKLVWYRAGNEVSENQWSDVLDVIKVKRDQLDLNYLRGWAGKLQVADLLEEALRG